MNSNVLLVILLCSAVVHLSVDAWILPLRSPRSSLTRRMAQSPKKRRFAQANHRQQFDANKMWNTRKQSIEQLEERLAKRWGTDLQHWQNYDDEDDEENHEAPRNVRDASSQRKGRAVRDPWDETPSKKKNQEREDRALTRVQKQQQEFYDEDDVGFESDKSVLTTKLVAPEPAGGSGFFRPRVAPEPVAAPSDGPEDIAKPKRVKREPTPLSIPLLDEEGAPLYLTLDQAVTNFRELAAVSDDDAEDEITMESDALWEDLGITNELLLENLQAMECTQPLQVQTQTVPDILGSTERDVVVGTYTGSGKTLAFLVPLVERLLAQGDAAVPISVVIVAPGRELASQIASVARDLVFDTSLRIALAIGGTTYKRNLEQIRKRKPHIVVGTPGRVAELIVGKPGEKGGRLKAGQLQTLVLDEFDALLQYKAHRDPTQAILETVGSRPQKVLCSATATDMIGSAKLKRYLKPDYIVARTDSSDALVTSADEGDVQVSRTVIHGVVHLQHRRFALETLRKILHTEPLPQQILIFAEDARKVRIVVEKLEGMGIIAAPLHGGMGSEKTDRAEVSKALREGYVGIVVATELAARGLDAPLLTHVINMDLPTDASHYAHRAGRCGRGGRPGVVINLTTNPLERNVPKKFADQLGIDMHSVEVRNSRLNLVDPSSQILDTR